MSSAVQVRTVGAVAEIGRATWNRVVGEAPPAFHHYDWFAALESAGCVGRDSGWLPLYVLFERAEQVFAIAPAFVKLNSEGEFVFDHSWARFAQTSLGIPYYPKLVVAVPFTPVNAPKILVAPGAEVAELPQLAAAAFAQIAEKMGLSSAHVLFPSEAQAHELEQAGCVLRYGVQFHWQNRGYGSFDDFLGRFNAKRRHQIRRERREVQAAGVKVEFLSGSDLSPPIADFAYRFYCATVDKFYWGRRYLNRAFFEEVCSKLAAQIQVVLAYDEAKGRPIAGAFNLLGPGALYGRYWGALEERPFLHFDVCYYRGIDYCIRENLAVFEPGAGGEHKLARGFLPAVTYSAHLLGDERLHGAVADFCARERELVLQHVREARADSGFRE